MSKRILSLLVIIAMITTFSVPFYALATEMDGSTIIVEDGSGLIVDVEEQAGGIVTATVKMKGIISFQSAVVSLKYDTANLLAYDRTAQTTAPISSSAISSANYVEKLSDLPGSWVVSNSNIFNGANGAVPAYLFIGYGKGATDTNIVLAHNEVKSLFKIYFKRVTGGTLNASTLSFYYKAVSTYAKFAYSGTVTVNQNAKPAYFVNNFITPVPVETPTPTPIPTPVPYTVTYVAGTGGTLTGATSEVVISGAKPATVPVPVPDSGYQFLNWTPSDPFTTNITANITFTANFTPLAIPTNSPSPTPTATPVVTTAPDFAIDESTGGATLHLTTNASFTTNFHYAAKLNGSPLKATWSIVGAPIAGVNIDANSGWLTLTQAFTGTTFTVSAVAQGGYSDTLVVTVDRPVVPNIKLVITENNGVKSVVNDLDTLSTAGGALKLSVTGGNSSCVYNFVATNFDNFNQKTTIASHVAGNALPIDWSPAKGKYVVEAVAVDANNTKVVLDMDKKTLIVVDGAVDPNPITMTMDVSVAGGYTLADLLAGKVLINTNITVSINATNAANALYRFKLTDLTTGTSEFKTAPANSVTFSVPNSDKYRLSAMVTNKYSRDYVQQYQDLYFRCAEVVYVPIAQKPTLTVDASNGHMSATQAGAVQDQTLYKFWHKAPGGQWEVIQDYGTASTCNVDITMSAGVHYFSVYTKSKTLSGWGEQFKCIAVVK